MKDSENIEQESPKRARYSDEALVASPLALDAPNQHAEPQASTHSLQIPMQLNVDGSTGFNSGSFVGQSYPISDESVKTVLDLGLAPYNYVFLPLTLDGQCGI
ncbi:hypothetical protein M406DRAFT_357127 [Cryphonectria parasitica EP155]|uniref:Uncharacterized protein n=1 Tax=Cryphonectria parasitica (strain ATCC 38755 / EP155) TaxID=660469 RepID=A0A9P4XZ61_CRYP1|nr:uncharacterized protein M406DRAFT_358708 [Cryphonectria parasitica EP155]XP_040774529.1 uncharacterized protein M406DRAFT_357127 [Cryphonectria parasitica EP155]KAF3760115.1 hypothetical protein M406DRAFT_358708 [Cryphonectria parasitica EP155]KAF3763568.1 hypothetical protein M406DRAFT_357127 [Cryphonectria parasitica EP155]